MVKVDREDSKRESEPDRERRERTTTRRRKKLSRATRDRNRGCFVRIARDVAAAASSVGTGRTNAAQAADSREIVRVDRWTVREGADRQTRQAADIGEKKGGKKGEILLLLSSAPSLQILPSLFSLFSSPLLFSLSLASPTGLSI